MDKTTHCNIFGKFDETHLAEINQALASDEFDIAVKYRNPTNIMRSAIISGNYKLFRDSLEVVDATYLSMIFEYNRVDWLVYTDLLQKTSLASYFIGLSEGAQNILAGIISRDHSYSQTEIDLLINCGTVLGYNFKDVAVYRDQFFEFPIHSHVLSTLKLLQEHKVYIQSFAQDYRDFLAPQRRVYGSPDLSMYTHIACAPILRATIKLYEDNCTNQILSALSSADRSIYKAYCKIIDVLPEEAYGYFNPEDIILSLCHHELYHKIPWKLIGLKSSNKPILNQSKYFVHEDLYQAIIKQTSEKNLVVTKRLNFVKKLFGFDLPKSSSNVFRYETLLHPEQLLMDINTYGGLLNLAVQIREKVSSLRAKKKKELTSDDSIVFGNRVVIFDNYIGSVEQTVKNFSLPPITQNNDFMYRGVKVKVKLSKLQLDILNQLNSSTEPILSREYDIDNEITLILLVSKNDLDGLLSLLKLGASKFESFKLNYMVSRIVALAFLFNQKQIYMHMLLHYKLQIELLEAAFLEYLPAISELSIDTLQKCSSNEDFYFSEGFVTAVREADPRTFKIIEQYL